MNYAKTGFLAFLVMSVLMLGLAQGVAAYSNAEVEIKTDVNATCPCSTLTPDDIKVLVKNTGNSTETFQISLNLPNADKWSGFITPNITLSPGEQKSLTIFVTPSCFVEPGVYNVGVGVTSKISDKSFLKEFRIAVLKCHWVEIEADEYELCEGVGSLANISFVNEGNSDEKIRISVSEKWVALPADTLELKKGEEKTLDVLLLPPINMTGAKMITITAESMTSYARRERGIIANVRKCYSSVLTVNPVRREVCPCKSADFTLGIKNTGLKDDRYSITYDNKSSDVDALSGETGEAELSVDIPCDRIKGEYPLAIKIESHAPATSKSNVTISVLPLEECYSVVLSTVNETKLVEVGRGVTFKVNVENKGRFTQVYELVLDAPKWAYLSDSQVKLSPGQAKDVYLYIAPNYYIPAGNYYAKIAAVSDIEQDSLELKVNVESDFYIEQNVTEPTTVPNQTIKENATMNVTMNISILTGGAVATEEAKEENRPLTQIIMLAILGAGIVIILILRFIVLIK